MFTLRDLSGGFAWDTESREHKGEEEGWDEYRKRCGISIAVTVPLGLGAMDGIGMFSDQDDPPHDIETLRKMLLEAPIVVGYNSIHWDRNVIVENTGRPAPVWNELDLYLIIKGALEKQGIKSWESGMWKLGAVAERTFRKAKTQSGAFAPTLSSQGRIAALVKYCLTDVLLTRQLAWHMSENGYVVGPKGVLLDVSEEMSNAIGRIRGARPQGSFIGTQGAPA